MFYFIKAAIAESAANGRHTCSFFVPNTFDNELLTWIIKESHKFDGASIECKYDHRYEGQHQETIIETDKIIEIEFSW